MFALPSRKKKKTRGSLHGFSSLSVTSQQPIRKESGYLATLSLEAVTAINRTVAARLERNFGLLAARRTGRGEHLTGAAIAATTAAVSAAATAAAAAAAVATTATAAAATAEVATALLGFLGIATGLATFGFVGEASLGEALLLIGRERELGAAIDAHNGFVLVGHEGTPRM
jgi:hypothetical protein